MVLFVNTVSKETKINNYKKIIEKNFFDSVNFSKYLIFKGGICSSLLKYT